MYCNNCGDKLNDSQKFCNKCGVQINESSITYIVCDRCNVGMIENVKIEGQHPFELGSDGTSYLKVYTKTKGIFLKPNQVKCRMCPKCGKIELYIDVK